MFTDDNIFITDENVVQLNEHGNIETYENVQDGSFHFEICKNAPIFNSILCKDGSKEQENHLSAIITDENRIDNRQFTISSVLIGSSTSTSKGKSPGKNLLLANNRNKNNLRKPFQCESCNTHFNFEQNLRLHQSCHTVAPITCSVCGKVFKRLSSYCGHINNHFINDNYTCNLCGLEFEYKEFFESHIESGHKSLEKLAIDSEKKKPRNYNSSVLRKHKCTICDKKFQKPSDLKRHQLTHSNIKPFQCLICCQGFTQKSSLNAHSSLHSGIKPFKCSKCSMRFSQNTHLQKHIKNLHPEDIDSQGKFPCEKCPCIFNSLRTLNRHTAKDHSDEHPINEEEDDLSIVARVMDDLKKFQAGLCGIELKSEQQNNIAKESEKTPEKFNTTFNENSFVNNENSNRVETTLTDNTKYFCCPICSKKFNRRFDMIRHIGTHTKPFECKLCKKNLATKYELQMHTIMHTKKRNIHQCTVCEKSFTTKQQFDLHAKEHADVKMLKCDLCEKKFRYNNNLRIHKNRHMQKRSSNQQLVNFKQPINIATKNQKKNSPLQEDVSRNFQCTYCGKKFKRSSHWLAHERIHSNLKSHICSICSRQFSSNSALNVHNKIHSGQKDYNCDQCYVKFTTAFDLRRHMSVHSSERNFVCPYCGKTYKTRDNCLQHIKTHREEIQLNIGKECDIANGKREMNLSSEEVCSDYALFIERNNLLTEESYLIENAEISEIELLSAAKPNKNIINWYDNLQEDYTRESNESPPLPCLDEITLNNSQPHRITSELEVNIQKKQNMDYECRTCGRAFKKLCDLRRHIRVHTKEKPFQCEICSKAFSLKSTLKSHKSTHILTHRIKFNCLVCNKEYYSKSSLRVHLLIHTGERPHKCTYCSKKFRTSGQKSWHIETHHLQKSHKQINSKNVT